MGVGGSGPGLLDKAALSLQWPTNANAPGRGSPKIFHCLTRLEYRVPLYLSNKAATASNVSQTPHIQYTHDTCVQLPRLLSLLTIFGRHNCVTIIRSASPGCLTSLVSRFLSDRAEIHSSPTQYHNGARNKDVGIAGAFRRRQRHLRRISTTPLESESKK